MSMIDQVVEYVNDPFDGPIEGEDFWIDEEGYIQVPADRVKTAALIMRKTNSSGMFDLQLVKIGQRGDAILLGFDSLAELAAVFTKQIGYKGDTLAEIKTDASGKFCVYINKKRLARMFNKLTPAKSFIKKLDKDLQNVAVETENFED